jgi:hypothetical protein
MKLKRQTEEEKLKRVKGKSAAKASSFELLM